MRLFFTISTFFLLTLLISACATPGGGPDMMWKSQARQYGENVRMFDQGVKTFEQADDMQIYAVCEALLETRDYGRLFPCLDNMDRRIEQGTYSVFMMPTEGMALSDYDKALEAVERNTSPSGFNAVVQALAYPIASVVSAGVATAAGGTTEDGLKMLVGDDVRTALPYAFMVAKLHLETGGTDLLI